MKRVWGNITKYYVLKLKRKDFNSLIRHSVKKLGNEDLDEISECLGGRVADENSERVKFGLGIWSL